MPNVTRLDKDCAELAPVPMKKGTYTLRISTPVQKADVAATLVVD